MLRTLFIIAFIFFGSNICSAQKVLQKEFTAEGIETLVIQDDAVFKISVKTEKSNSIKVLVKIAGENSESVILEEKFQHGELDLSTGFTPFFEKINDKLAANKVLSIEMEIVVPPQISLRLKSKIASVIATGNYKNVEIGLDEGSCVLKDFSGNAILLTKLGNITVYAKDEVSGTGVSRHSEVKNTLPKKGKFHIEAESINGAISLLQME